MPSPDSNPDVEAAFARYVDLAKRGRVASAEEFIATCPEGIRRDVAMRIHAYRQIRRWSEELGAQVGAGGRLGSYRLLSPLGSGGMGSVWAAEHVETGERFAVKVLHPHLTLSKTARERFRREAAAIARLHHPVFASIKAVGSTDKLEYIVMELIRGSSLATWIAERCPAGERPATSIQEVMRLVVTIAEGLVAAHEAGVVHRDIKPGNILIDTAGRPRVVDLGLAQLVGAAPITQTGESAGTPCYMSPEQLGGSRERIDARTDVFSLGIVLYEALTGRRPFAGAEGLQLKNAIQFDDPVDPCALRPDMPEDLARICCHALEKQPSHRYQTMRSFADDLQRLLRGEAIGWRRPGPLIRVGRRMRLRPRPWLAAGGALALIGVISILVFHPGSLVVAAADGSSAADGDASDRLFDSMLVPIHDALARDARVSGLQLIENLGGVLDKTPAPPSAARAEKYRKLADMAVQAGGLLVARKFLDQADGVAAALPGVRPDLTRQIRSTRATLAVAEGDSERAIALARQSLAEAPPDAVLERARLSCTIGGALREIGQVRDSLGMLQEAHDRAVQELGPEDAATLDLTCELALTLTEGDRPAESEALLRPIISSLERNPRGDNHSLITAQTFLARDLADQGDTAGAEAMLADVLWTSMTLMGPNHPLTVSALAQAGTVAYLQHDLAGAESMLRSAVGAVIDGRGLPSSQTLEASNNLSVLLASDGRTAEAVAIARSAYDGFCELSGPTSPAALTAAFNLAQREPDDHVAEALFRDIAAARCEALGDTHPKTLSARSERANRLKQLGRYDEATSELADVLWLWRSQGKLATEPGLSAARNLAVVRLVAHHPEECAAILEPLTPLVDQVFGHDSARAIEQAYILGYAREQEGRMDEARSLMETALGRARHVLGETAPLTLQVKRELEGLGQTGAAATAKPGP